MITNYGYKTLFWIIGGIAALRFLAPSPIEEGNPAITYGGDGGGCGCGG